MTDIKTFWDWFIEVENEIYNHLEQQPNHYAFLVHEALLAIHPDIVFDIPFETQNGKREFILSADGDASLFPLIKSIVDAAPDLDNWIVYNLRPRTNQIDQAIDLDGLYLEYEDIFFSYLDQELPLSLSIFIKGYDLKDNRYVHGYFLLLDTLLGEYNAVTYTETIAIHPYDDSAQLHRFLTLRDLFDKLHHKQS